MNIRLYHGRILTMKEEDIFRGEIWISKGYIVHIINYEDWLDKDMKVNVVDGISYVWDKEIDCQDNLIMPTFKNAHAHAPMTFLRSYADDLPLSSWLFEQVFPAEAKLEKDDIYHLSRVALLEYLTSGIGASFEMYYHPEELAKAAVDMGFRMVLCSSSIGQLGENNSNLSKLEDEYNTYNHYHELISYHLGFHGEYTTSREFISEIGQLAKKYKAPVYMHSQETKKEVDECIMRHGMTPTKLFDELGIFDYGGGCFHMVHTNSEDMDIIKKRNVFIVTNPGSNTKLASGIAPIGEFCRRDIPVAIGTDGPASNNCLDMFREMFLVTGLAKLLENDASAMKAENVLSMATVNGALALGLTSSDVLGVGKNADLIIIDLHRPNMQPINNLKKNIVYSGSKENIKMTMINGRILYEDGRFADHIHVEEIYQKANEITQRIFNR